MIALTWRGAPSTRKIYKPCADFVTKKKQRQKILKPRSPSAGVEGFCKGAGRVERKTKEMTEKTKISLRKIEVQKRLREIAGLEGDQLTQEIRNEAAALSTEHSGLDVASFGSVDN